MGGLHTKAVETSTVLSSLLRIKIILVNFISLLLTHSQLSILHIAGWNKPPNFCYFWCFALFFVKQSLHHQWYQSGLLVAFQYSLNGFLFQHFQQTFQPFNHTKQVLQTSFFFLNWSLVFHCQHTQQSSNQNAFSNGVDFIPSSCFSQPFLKSSACLGLLVCSFSILLTFSTDFLKSFSRSISSLFLLIVEVSFFCKLLIVFCASTSSCPSALYFSAHTSHLPLSVSIVSFCASNFFSSKVYAFVWNLTSAQAFCSNICCSSNVFLLIHIAM